MRLHPITLLSTVTCINAFSPSSLNHVARKIIITNNNNPTTPLTNLFNTATDTDTEIGSFIATELRGAAMKLHTRAQAPKEGQAVEKPQPKEKYVPTHLDYLKFFAGFMSFSNFSYSKFYYFSYSNFLLSVHF